MLDFWGVIWFFNDESEEDSFIVGIHPPLKEPLNSSRAQAKSLKMGILILGNYHLKLATTSNHLQITGVCRNAATRFHKIIMNDLHVAHVSNLVGNI